MRIQENLEKSKYEADGKISIQGTTIPYHTICEDHFFVDEENNPVASIFSYAYFRSDIQDNSKRPIATVYKGNIIKNLIMDCQSYTKYRPNETTGGIFV